MASLHKEILIDASSEAIWDAARDVVALHTRLVPGFVTDCRLEGEVRVVTFKNRMVAREPILSVDDARKRLAWGLIGGAATHYNAVLQISERDGKALVTWTSDFLPHGLAESISPMQDAGLQAMKRAFEPA